MRRPDTSVFLLSPLFRGAACLDATDGHLGLSSFSTFQRCFLLGCGGRTPRSFRFFLFSGVHMAAMGRPDTSVFPLFLFSGVHMAAMGRPDTSVFMLFPLFRCAHGCDEATGHLGLSAFSSFQGCYRRYYKSVSIFSGGTISAELRMPDFLEEEGDTSCRTV